MDQPIWDAVVLSRVRHLHLKARYLASAILQGEHRSRRVGQAVEFAGYQEYLPGMDLRGLDWRVYGRSDRYVIKRFETETELPCTVVLDLSGDMGTGASGRVALPDLERGKASYAIVLAATLLYFLHRHGEPVGLELVAGEGVTHSSLPPRSGRNHLQLLFLQLASVRPGGVADLGPSLARVGQRTRRRSWVGVITDGMEEPVRWLPALGAFARRGTDLRLFHLYDRSEWAMSFSAPALFYSPEGGEPLAVDPHGAAAAFAEVAREYVDEVRGGVVRFGGRYLPVPTDLPMEQVIRSAVLDRPLGVELP
ncbi:MAG TPA: DUF58 domain-containing protein [Deltaproteobacteria bacterium]|nr:DUF58 domain-containing protein [Deltaproteobacteria bacterium]